MVSIAKKRFSTLRKAFRHTDTDATEETVEGSWIGIDLGATNTCFGYVKDGLI